MDGATEASPAVGAEVDVTALELGPARDVAARHVAGGLLPCVAFGLVDTAGRTVSHVMPRPGRHLDADSVFFLASVSKAIVATALMQLVEEERLDLRAPLVRYLGELDPDGAGSVSAWHILTHTSGLPDIPVERLKRRQPGYAATLRSVAASRPSFPPGSRYEYVSAPWVLLSEAMARLDGRPFPDVLARRLTGPLGMTSTTFDPRPMRARLEPVVGGYLENRIVQAVLLRYLARSHLPGGGLFGSLADLLRLGRALLPAPGPTSGPRVLRQPAIDEMGRLQAEGLEHVAQDGSVHEIRQGLGWRKPQAGWPGSARTITHGGISGCRIWIDPDAGFACAFLTSRWQAPLAPSLAVIEAIYEVLGRG
jgi:serine-type D-Ala-D-Ala carboxypeptidase